VGGRITQEIVVEAEKAKVKEVEAVTALVLALVRESYAMMFKLDQKKNRLRQLKAPSIAEEPRFLCADGDPAAPMPSPTRDGRDYCSG
jgi:hypothetical protein